MLPRILLALVLPGCVTVYQPLVTLQRPAVINPELANFEGLTLMVRCLPTDYTDSGDSEALCQNVRTLFANQGAKVEVEVPESDLPLRNPADAKADLVIELSSRRLHYENSALLWTLFYATATLIPAVTEATFAQDVVIRDTDGFLLASEVLQGRFIRYIGLGFWGINKLMDLIVRTPEEQLTGDQAKVDFSRDYYAHLSQLALQGRMRAMVLRSFEQTARSGGAAPAPAPAPAKPGPPPASGPAPAAPLPAPKPKPLPLKAPTQDPDSQWEAAPFPSKASPK